MELNDAKTLLVGQFVNEPMFEAAVDALKAANSLPADDEEPLSTSSLVSLLLEIVSPNPAAYAGLKSVEGQTVVGALAEILNTDPLLIRVQSVTVCQTAPWVSICYYDDSTVDFHGEEITPLRIRSEVVISGGLVAVLAKEKQASTRARWSLHTG